MSDLEWSFAKASTESRWLPIVTFIKNKEFFFRFDLKSDRLQIIYQPGVSSWKNTEYIHSRSWPNVVNDFQGWLASIKSEFYQPDLWDDAYSESALLLHGSADKSNVPFTETERDLIAERLNRLEQELQRGQLTDDQLNRIASDVKYLKEASSRLGRKDWKMLSVSVLLGIATTVNPTEARAVFQKALQILQPIFQQLIES